MIVFGRPNLDFGRGFYLTDLRAPAEEWAVRQADKEFSYLLFPAYDRDWLHRRQNVGAFPHLIDGCVGYVLQEQHLPSVSR